MAVAFIHGAMARASLVSGAKETARAYTRQSTETGTRVSYSTINSTAMVDISSRQVYFHNKISVYRKSKQKKNFLIVIK
jgi:hypothetical protein